MRYTHRFKRRFDIPSADPMLKNNVTDKKSKAKMHFRNVKKNDIL